MIKPTTSKSANVNYLAKIFQLKSKQIHEHPNADRLVLVKVDGLPIIASKDIVPDEWYVYFVSESKIHKDFLKETNCYRKPELNTDPSKKGFFKPSGRVETVKLRGEYSSGYMAPLKDIESFLGGSVEREEVYFDSLDDFKLVEKYVIKYDQGSEGQSLSKGDKKASKLNIVPGQFNFHKDTKNLRHMLYEIKPDTNLEITYKLHGTSAVIGKVLFQKPAKWYHKLFNLVPKTYYDYVWSSRKVIKNNNSSGYYSEDIWTIVKDEIKDKIPNGYTLYGEIVGYLPDGGAIQKSYDYGCKPREHDFYVYRITFTDKDGVVSELNYREIEEFCVERGLKVPQLMYKGLASGLVKDSSMDVRGITNELRSIVNAGSTIDKDLILEGLEEIDSIYSSNNLEVFQEKILNELETRYNNKNCYMCENPVPEEGVIVRVINNQINKFEAYKLKSVSFLLHESKEADQNIPDIESIN